MDIIELPYFPADTVLRFCLDAMRYRQRSAVIRDDQGKLDLLKAGDIYDGLAREISILGKVKSNNPVFKLTINEVEKWNLDPADPKRTWDRYEKFLDSVEASYALLGTTAVSCFVVTRHEGQAGALSAGPKDCYCSGPDQHEFPPPSVSSNDRCDRCGYPVHCEY